MYVLLDDGGDILTKRRFSYGNLKKRVWRYAFRGKGI